MSTSLDYHAHRPKRVKSPPTAAQKKRFFIAYATGSILVFILALLDLWEQRIDFNVSKGVMGAALILLFVSLGVSGAMFILWLTRLFEFKENWRRRFAVSLSFIVPMSILALTCIVVGLEIPFALAFHYSRPALERAIAEVRANPAKGTIHRTIGCLPIDSINVEADKATIVVTGSEDIDTTPFLMWKRDGTRPSGKYYRVESLGTGWYWVNW